MYSKSNLSIIPRLALVALCLMLVISGCEKKSGESSSGKAFTPTKPITMIMPFAAGGSSDLLARAVEKVWTKYCPQPVTIVNKTGGAGVEGATFVSNSKPDGYTMVMGYGSGHDLVTPHMQKMDYDPFKALKPVCRLSVHSVVLEVPADSEFRSVKDIIDWAKKEKKPVTCAVGTTMGAVDIVVRGVGKKTGIEITPVPHSGGSQAITTLIGKQTMMAGNHPSEILTQYKAGKLKPIAIATPERDPSLPDVPTLKEQGIDFYTWGSVKGVAMPPDTPKEIVDYYAGVFKKICEDTDFKKAMQDMLQPIQYQGPEEFSKFMKQAYDDYGKLVKELGFEKK